MIGKKPLRFLLSQCISLISGHRKGGKVKGKGQQTWELWRATSRSGSSNLVALTAPLEAASIRSLSCCSSSQCGICGISAPRQRPWHRAGSEGCGFGTTSCHQSQLCDCPSPLWVWACPGSCLQGSGFLWGSWVCCFACCTFIPSLLSVCRLLRGCFLSGWIFWVERTLKDPYKLQLFCSKQKIYSSLSSEGHTE